MRPVHLGVVATIFLLLSMSASYGSSGSQVNASITVLCPFKLSLSMLSIYPQTPTVTVNYTATTTAVCGLTNMNGQFEVVDQSSNQVAYQQAISVPTSGLSTITNSITFSTSNMMTSNSYSAELALSEGGTYSVYTSNTFQLVSFANVIISAFNSSQQQFNVGQIVSFGISLQNIGDVASSNIIMQLNITGAANFNSVYVVPALSPSQNYNSLLQLPNITSVPGSYIAYITLSYNSLGTPEVVRSGNFVYSVISPSHGSGSSPIKPTAPITVNPITTLPQISFTSMPLMSSGEQGRTTQSELGLKNIGIVPEQLEIAVGSEYNSVFSLSSNSLYLLPNQSADVAMYFKSNASMETGVYTVPITISAIYQNGQSAIGTEYLTFSIYTQGTDQPTIESQIYLTNSSKSASGVISIIAPKDRNIANATLVQWIPLSVAANISDINVYGLPNNITIENGSYRISSYIGNLPKNQTIYEYYSINSPTNSQFLIRSQYSLYTLSATQTGDILKLAEISAPTITGNQTANITVSVLYTGTAATHILIYLVTPPAIVLENNTENFSALPNQLIVSTFKIKKHPNNGTYIMQLYIKAPKANLSYGIPIVIVPGTAASGIQRPAITATTLRYAEDGVALTLIILTIVIVVSAGGRQRYSAERAGHLINIREQIKRD